MTIFIGTSGYSYPKWKGKFYPKALPTKQMLRYYGEHFPAVEINSTFNALPKVSVLEAWMSDVPATFQFVLKAPKQITHIHRLKNSEELVTRFHEVAQTLGKQRGPLLFQLPPNLKKDLPRLRDFLALLPAKCRAAFEFRNMSWFDEEVFDLLRERGVALCIADAEDDLQVPFVATADWGYLRLRREEYDEAQLKDWAKRIKSENWQEAFVFFRHEDEGKGPRFAEQLIQLTR